MKISICDECYYHQNKKLTEAKYRTGYTGHSKLDLCQEHRNVTQGKSVAELDSYIFELEFGNIKVEIVENPELKPAKA